jgi:putative methyltransferase (TIGR04325 family)
MTAAAIRHLALPFLRSVSSGMQRSLAPLRAAGGRLRYLSPVSRRFSGAYASYGEAFEHAKRISIAGYDHDEVAPVSYEAMCRLTPWDYPVLFWLARLGGGIGSLVDAGGHMGTKYRAFREPLGLDASFDWVVYDLPAIVRAGRRKAEEDGLHGLRFVDRMEDTGAVDLFLGSGLLQYLDVPLADLLGHMAELPRHLLLNKVALHTKAPIVTLEKIGKAYVPYQMRDETTLIGEITSLGYRMADRWTVPFLSHVIETHPELGASTSAGYYFRLDC